MTETTDRDVRALVHALVQHAPAPPPLAFETGNGARPRTRTRRLVAVTGAAALVAAAITWIALGSGASHRPARVTITAPVDPGLAALRRPIALAGGPTVRVVSRRGIVSVKADVRAITDPRAAVTCCVQWSTDGHWVAFLAGADAQDAPGGRLVVTRADGSHRTDFGPGISAFALGRGVVAISTARGVSLSAFDGRHAGETVVLTSVAAKGIAWSPDATRLALATPEANFTGELRIVTVDDGASCASLAACVHVGAPLDVGPHDPHFQVRIAAWRPDGGALAVWMETLEDNGRLDGAPLVVVSIDHRAPPITLVSTVVQPDWVQWSPDGQRLAVIAGVGRFQLDEARQLTVCNVADHGFLCRKLTPKSVLARDPAWSPDGRTLLYTAITAAESTRLANQAPGQWQPLFAHREVRAIGADGRGDHAVTEVAPGAGGLQFLDATHLLVVHARQVQQIDLARGTVVTVGTLVENPSTDPSYKEPHAMPDDHPYEGTESGPGGWSTWFVAAPPT